MKNRRFGLYMLLSLKRCLRLLPSVLVLSLLLLGATMLIGSAAVEAGYDSEEKKKEQVGVVGDFDNAYLRLGLYALEHLDSSRYSIEIVRCESEREAARSLQSGNLHAYIVVPDGFAEALYEGQTLPITYVATEGAVGIGAMLIDEMVDAVSTMVTQTENDIYGVQNYLREAGHPQPYEAGDRLAEEYLGLILAREELYDLKLVGVSRGLSFGEYYLCALTALFLLLWGVACAPVFSNAHMPLKRTLRSSGLTAPAQVLAEFAAYAVLMAVSLVCIGAVACAALALLFPNGLSLLETDADALRVCLTAALVPAVCLCGLQQLLYELSRGAVSAMLMQFVTAVAMGYVCGCFYPLWALPEAVQKLGSALPAGVTMEFLGGVLTGESTLAALAKLAGYLAVFLLLTCLMRNAALKNTEGGGRE